jgi:hypothetical protein
MKDENVLTKREILHVLIDKLLDIEETTTRGVTFDYCTSLGVNFHAITSPSRHGDRIRPEWRDWYLTKESFEKCLREITEINNTPDREPEVTVKLTESKAKELGLIA